MVEINGERGGEAKDGTSRIKQPWQLFDLQWVARLRRVAV
jgi:hypothetical protein